MKSISISDCFLQIIIMHYMINKNWIVQTVFKHFIILNTHTRGKKVNYSCKTDLLNNFLRIECIVVLCQMFYHNFWFLFVNILYKVTVFNWNFRVIGSVVSEQNNTYSLGCKQQLKCYKKNYVLLKSFMSDQKY